MLLLYTSVMLPVYLLFAVVLQSSIFIVHKIVTVPVYVLLITVPRFFVAHWVVTVLFPLLLTEFLLSLFLCCSLDCYCPFSSVAHWIFSIPYPLLFTGLLQSQIFALLTGVLRSKFLVFFCCLFTA